MKNNSDNCIEKALGNKRYFLAILSCFGLLIPLAMRCEIGIAIIKMTEYRDKEVLINNENASFYKTIRVREVAWSDMKISLIEASFFIGYTLFSIPGGFLSTILSANLVLGISVLTSAILNFAVPIFVRFKFGFASVFIVRILQGMAEGCLYPSIHGFWRHWAPKQERSKLITISFFGMAVGPIIGYPISGILTKHLGWPSNFYFWGATAIIWVIIWLVISKKAPSHDTCISESERLYIEKNTSTIQVTARQVPWISIMTSLPVWALIFANIGRNWTYQFSFTGLPTFLRNKFQESSLNLGFHMSVPYIIMAILTPLSGIMADWMIKRNHSIVSVRKIFNTVGFGIAGLCFLVLGFVPYLWLTTTILSLGLGSFGIGLSGFGVNHLDIADIYAGVLMGISNGIGTLAGILAPLVAMEITTRYSVSNGWAIFFVLSGLIHIATVIFYAIFASGETQPWSDPTASTKDIEEDKKPIPLNSE